MSKLREALPQPRALWVTVLLLPLLVPFVTSNLSWLGIEHVPGTDAVLTPKLVVAAVLLLIGCIAWMRQSVSGTMGLRWDDALWLMCGLLGIATLSTFASLSPWQSLFGSYWFKQGLIVMLMLGVVVFLVVQLVRDASAARLLAAAVVVGSMPVALYALVQVAGLDPLFWGAPSWALTRGFSTIANPDTLGGYLIIPAVVALGCALTAPRPVSRFVCWGAFGVLATSLLLTQVRGAWVGMLAAGLVYLAYVVKRHVRFERSDWIAVGLVLVLLLGAGIWAREGIVRRIESVFTGDVEASAGRFAIWETSARVAMQQPLLGAGPDALRFGYYAARSADHERYGGYNTIADDAHNLPLQIAATLGIPALLIALAFALFIARRSFRAAFADDDPVGDPVYAAWLAGVAGYLVYACFGPSNVATNLMLALGFGVLIGMHARSVELPSRGALSAVGWSLVAIGLLATVTSGLTFIGEQHYVRSRILEGDEAISASEQAIAASPWTWNYRAQRVSLIADRAERATAPAWEDAEREVILEYNDLIRFSPAEYTSYVRFSNQLLAMPSKSPEVIGLAAQVSELALAVYPHGLAARESGARAYMALEQYDKAAALLEDEWDSDPEYEQPGIVYAYALMGAERADDALAVIDYLGEQFPDDEEVERLVEIAGELRGGQ